MNRFDLYELAVQAPELQARFLRALHGGAPLTLREDFAGPAAIARAWLALDPRHHAVAVDADPEPLAHARDRLHSAGPEAMRRMNFVNDDVRACRAPADIIAAFNFGACELHARADLLAWLRGARESLNQRGILVCDLYGGAEAHLPGQTDQSLNTPDGPATYTWEQRDADPLTGRVRNAMHFRLPDGTPLRDAFVYDWRLWSVPELRDALREAGFAHTEVHTSYGGAISDALNPVPRAHEEFDPVDDTFVAYVVARRG